MKKQILEKQIYKNLLMDGLIFLISNKLGALSIIKNEELSDQVVELKPAVESVPSYIAFSKKRGLTDLRDDLDEVLIAMKNDGTIDKNN